MASISAVTEDSEEWMAEPVVSRLSSRVRTTLVGASAFDERAALRLREGDLVFARSREPRVLSLLERVEAAGARVVNTPASIGRARHRLTSIGLARDAGAPVPRDFEGPLDELPFAQAVLKRVFDDGRSTTERWDGRTRGRRVVYAQEPLPGAWEHKLYVVGEQVFAFVQRPTLDEPEKLSTRRRVSPDAQLVAHARRVAAEVGLELAGVDFIEDAAGVPLVTDVNSNQGVHAFEEGVEALAAYLLRRLAGC